MLVLNVGILLAPLVLSGKISREASGKTDLPYLYCPSKTISRWWW
jgi:hypothetical protein